MKAENMKNRVSESLHNSDSEKTEQVPQPFEKREVKPINHKLQLKKDAATLNGEEELYIISILYGPGWKAGELDALPKEERSKYVAAINKGLNYLSHDDRDRFIGKLSAILQTQARQDLWEVNHFLILKAIDSLTREYNRFPSKQELAKDTGLSRVTITKHLREYYKSEKYAERQDEYLVMRENVLARLYKFASTGDTKAAKIFLDNTSMVEPKRSIQNQQNNFIQINGATITQEQIKLLPVDQQARLFEMLQSVSSTLV
jgi:hypothetical protein